jgi:hypothetical protein
MALAYNKAIETGFRNTNNFKATSKSIVSKIIVFGY